MRDWLNIEKEKIFEGKDENGNRYLSQFLKDYKDTFNPDIINAGCQRCLEDYYQKFILKLKTMSKDKTNTGYVLKSKYEGIPLKFGSRTQVYNSNLTDEIANELLKNHPAGEKLFDVIPEKEESEEVTDLSKMSRYQLDELAEELGINPKDYSNKAEISAAIEDVQKAKEESEEVTD